MKILLRVNAASDWKCRPYVGVETIARISNESFSNWNEKLIQRMNEDIKKWQHEDLLEDLEVCFEEGSDLLQARKNLEEWNWVNKERWEMTLGGERELSPDGLRKFCGGSDGDRWSITYHVITEDMVG